MTSVRYLSNWIREAGRGHVTAVLSWGGFFIYTAVSLLGIRADSDYFFGIGNESLLNLCVGLGILAAAAEFWYLEQPVKLDFYYSLPVKRGTVFWSRYVHGILHAVSALVISVTVLGIYACRMDGDFLAYAGFYMVRSILIFTAAFLVFYHIGIVSFLAGGRFVTVLLFFLLFVFLGRSVTRRIIGAYAEHFFKTFYRIPALDCLEEMLTPRFLLRKLSGCSLPDKRDVLEYVPDPGTVLAAALWIIVPVLLILFLERKRRVENVGKLFAFSGAERSVLFLLSVVPALCLGNLFAGSGVVFAVLLHILIELFTGSRGKALFKRKWQLLSEVLAVLFVTGGYAAGAGVFDGFFPEREELLSVRICVSGVDMSQKEWEENTFGKESCAAERQLEQYKLTGDGMGEALSWLEGLECDARTEEERYTFVTVCYEGKDEKEHYRVYPVTEEEFLAFSGVFETREYKEKAYPALLWEDVGDNSFTWEDGVRKHQVLGLTKEEKEAFLALYKEEVYAFRMEELRGEVPAGIVEMRSDKWGETQELLIYPFFEKTYKFLRKHGDIKEDLMDYPVRSLKVMDVRPAGEGMTGGVTMEHYETEEELREWRGRLVWQELDVQPLLSPLDFGAEIELEAEEPESGAAVTVKCCEKVKK